MDNICDVCNNDFLDCECAIGIQPSCNITGDCESCDG